MSAWQKMAISTSANWKLWLHILTTHPTIRLIGTRTYPPALSFQATLASLTFPLLEGEKRWPFDYLWTVNGFVSITGSWKENVGRHLFKSSSCFFLQQTQLNSKQLVLRWGKKWYFSDILTGLSSGGKLSYRALLLKHSVICERSQEPSPEYKETEESGGVWCSHFHRFR